MKKETVQAQEKNSSANSPTRCGKKQDKKPSEPTGSSLKPPSGASNASSDTPDLKSVIYSMGDSVPSEFREHITILEASALLIDDKKDRRSFLRELTKPIPLAQKKLGKKSTLTPAQRKAARMEIKTLTREILNHEEDHRSALSHLTKLVNDGRTSIDMQILRDRSQSAHYLGRNKNYIQNNVVKTINEVYSESAAEITSLVRASKINGKKGIADFQTMFIEFLRTHKYELSVLCTGKEPFKQEVVTTIRAALRSWNPRSGELSL